VISPPGVTALGVPVFVTATSGRSCPALVVTVAALLATLGSVVLEVTVATFVMEPLAAKGNFTTMLNTALAPFASDGAVMVTVPPLPTPGALMVNGGPDVCVAETSVVPAGSGSLSERLAADDGPLLVSVTV
jgi:hypothetical protein